MSSIVEKGQSESVVYCGNPLINLDGIYGKESRANGIRCMQKAMNADYGLSLVVDGIWGVGSIEAFGNHYVELGESQELVRALQINLMLRGFDPNGVDGVFGNDTFVAVQAFQSSVGLVADGVAGVNTFAYLIDAIRNFTPTEFMCQCGCGSGDAIGELKMKAQLLRDKIGLPMTITDGYRCPSYNASVGGTSDSLHMQGKAFDMQVFKNDTYHMTDADQQLYREYAHQCGLTTGNYYGSGGGWMHCQIGRNDYNEWP